ncbi:hypothetical protein SLEP1_g40472 [Rubroshorea leprosula]|uniref:F-box domain-containing protein n=1 Tax=Rubroshorea leprosula TaxID=152421 RepID=A0AAV5L3Y9_9ROSI|nr:hypothetical protein SLEP1_g40472 [Rubroshorea leprosula]
MEHLPVEVIGDILSHLRTALDVVVASATCKKWREAFQYYLHSLTFFDGASHIYCDLRSDRLKTITTQTILQPRGYGVYHSF